MSLSSQRVTGMVLAWSTGVVTANSAATAAASELRLGIRGVVGGGIDDIDAPPYRQGPPIRPR
jgi:hypothetical protein